MGFFLSQLLADITIVSKSPALYFLNVFLSDNFYNSLFLLYKYSLHSLRLLKF